MKKSMIALAVLGSVASVAQAASSVTLYGRLDVGYQKTKGVSISQGTPLNKDGFSTEGETRLGIKGSEDLGNGLSATFQLEGRFDGSTVANRWIKKAKNWRFLIVSQRLA